VAQTVLITGGAGFIGAHLASRLLAEGNDVRVLDSLLPQVHGTTDRPPYLSPDVELVVGDVRDRDAVLKSLTGVDRVVHFAARVGVGQSMYEIEDYTSVNDSGTAVLLQALLDNPVERLLVASSMSIYGEGLYLGPDGQPLRPAPRTREQLAARQWEPVGPDGEPLTPAPTPETKTPELSSVYALTKYDQERLCLLFGEAYQVPTTALRFFNVYGPYQSLNNPYTGVLAIFASRLLNDRPPVIFEDGGQSRDFVSVHDIARACALALATPAAAGHVLNVGGGTSTSVAEVGRRLATVLGKEHIEPEIVGKYRVGDIRHCFADISLAERVLGYRPEVALEDGMAELAAWLETQEATDSVENATSELVARGLTV
jgi:dTDP-L-rhamnose 4-epimerase